LADVAAMGAVPVALLVGFAAPGDLAVAWARDLVAGLAEECARAGATVAGGDTSGADTIVLAITALGDLGGRDPVTRSGARPGHPGLAAAARVLSGDAVLGRDSGPGRPGALGGDAVLDWVLTGGEDHALAATFPPDCALPPHWAVIGQVRAGHGVLVNGSKMT